MWTLSCLQQSLMAVAVQRDSLSPAVMGKQDRRGAPDGEEKVVYCKAFW